MAKKHPIKERFERLVARIPESGCWLYLGPLSKSGYGKVTVDDQKTVRAHRWSWELRFGPIPEGMLVCHRCDVRSCINPDHLFLGTPTDNMLDMSRKGRSKKQNGSLNVCAKLDEEKVVEVRALAAAGERGIAIARRFGISDSNVSMIVKGISWKHVKTGLP